LIYFFAVSYACHGSGRLALQPIHHILKKGLMKFNEQYKGINVTVSTEKTDAKWTSKAEVLFPRGERLTVGEDGSPYSTEEEARSAAFSLAAEAIDRSRTDIGKR